MAMNLAGGACRFYSSCTRVSARVWTPARRREEYGVPFAPARRCCPARLRPARRAACGSSLYSVRVQIQIYFARSRTRLGRLSPRLCYLLCSIAAAATRCTYGHAAGVRPTLRCAAVRALRLLHVQLATRESWAWCLVRFCACERGSGLALRLGPDSARFLPLNRAPAERNEELTVIFASVAAQLTEAVEPTARPRRPREACFRGAIRSTPPSSAYASASPSSSTSSRPAARP